jgi:hypothetical protein
VCAAGTQVGSTAVAAVFVDKLIGSNYSVPLFEKEGLGEIF